MSKKMIAILVLIIGMLFATFAFKSIVLGSSPLITLPEAPALTGAISQGLGVSDNKLPVAGKDYSLNDTHYLVNKTWVVIKIASANRGEENAVIIMQKAGDSFHIILGPGTAFSTIDTQSLPKEVKDYLNQIGVFIYEP